MRRSIILFLVCVVALSVMAQASQSVAQTDTAPVPDGYSQVFVARIFRTDIPAMSDGNIASVVQALRSSRLTKIGKRMLRAVEQLPEQLEAKGYVVRQDAAEMKQYAGLADTMPLTAREKELLVSTSVSPWTTTYDIGKSAFKDGYDGDEWALLQKAGRMAIASRQLFGTDDRLSPLFTEEDLRTVSDQYNEWMWRAAGPSPDSYAFTLESAVSHWDEIKRDIEGAMAGKAADSVKSYPLSTDRMMRLVSLIGFNNYSDEHVNNLERFLPVGTVLEIRVYANGDKHIVKLVLNGKDKNTFGRPRQMPPYQEWRMFSSYMAKRISANALHRDIYGMGDGRIFEPNGMVVWAPIVVNGRLQGICGSHPTEDGGDYGAFTMSVSLAGQGVAAETARDEACPEAVMTERHPDYAAFSLDGGRARLDMTGMAHTGFFRLTARKGCRVVLTFAPVGKDGSLERDTAANGIFGYTPVNGRTGKSGFNSWFGFEFSTPPAGSGIGHGKAWAAFDLAGGDELLVKAANSFTGKDGLLYNFEQEIPHWEFNDTRMRNVGAWELRMRRKLFQQTLTPANRQEKLGELFSMSVLPRQISDKNGRYPSFADGSKIMVKSLGKFGNKPLFEKVYGDFPLGNGKAIWDYQWQTNDLRNVFVQSLVYKVQETGAVSDAEQKVFDDAKAAGLSNIKW